MPQACHVHHENKCILCLILNKALLSQMCFYLSGSVFTPITGLNLSKTLLAASNIVPSPTEKAKQKLVSLHILVCQTKYSHMHCSITTTCFCIDNWSGKLHKNKTGPQNYWHLSTQSSDNWIQDGKCDWKKYDLSDSYTGPDNWIWQKQVWKEIYENFCTFISW